MISHIIVEGVDRLGKDTLIRGIQDANGFYQVLHYQKPLLLKKFVTEAIDHGLTGQQEIKAYAFKAYQQTSFRSMFWMMKNTHPRIICNRAHLGEAVYAKRYRGYDGDYVFNLEQQFQFPDSPLEKTLLVLLYTNDFTFIEDDGQSFDVTKREEEQHDFVKAFDMSLMPHKMMINVNAGGHFKDRSEVLQQVLEKLK